MKHTVFSYLFSAVAFIVLPVLGGLNLDEMGLALMAAVIGLMYLLGYAGGLFPQNKNRPRRGNVDGRQGQSLYRYYSGN